MIRALAVLLAFASVARADIESGPKAGAPVPELKVFAVTGTVESKDLEIAKERGDKPTVFVFVNAEKFSRPMARFLKVLDGKVADVTDAETVAVWVGGDAAKNKEYLPKAQQSLNFGKTALTVSGVEEPKGWAINADAHATAVIVVKGKVVKSFPFVSINETDVKPVLAELVKAVGK
jgi:hypothetical protein